MTPRLARLRLFFEGLPLDLRSLAGGLCRGIAWAVGRRRGIGDRLNKLYHLCLIPKTAALATADKITTVVVNSVVDAVGVLATLANYYQNL